MRYDARLRGQPERNEKRKRPRLPIGSQETVDPDLADLARQAHQSPHGMLRLQQAIGNQAAARLMAQRAEELEEEEEEELIVPGPRSHRAEELEEEEEEELAVPGPRSQQSLSDQRAAPHASATGVIGDAINLDGQSLYGWDRTITADDVATVINGVIPTASGGEAMPRIVIFSGTHGDEEGHLVNDATSRGFVGEDQATASAVMTANPGVQVEVIDVVTSYPTKPNLTAVYGLTDYIRILGWCFSNRSYGLGDAIKSNWWAAPDDL